MTRAELIDRLTKAMFRQEGGMRPGTLGHTLCNPGNITYWSRAYPLWLKGKQLFDQAKPVKGAYVDFTAWAHGDRHKAEAEGWRVFRANVGQHIDGKYFPPVVDIKTGKKRKYPTLREMIHGYAPNGDGANDENVYTTNVASWAGVNPDAVLKDLITDDDLPSAA